MRICIVTSDPQLADQSRNVLQDRLSPVVQVGETDEVHVITYRRRRRRPKPGIDKTRFRIWWEDRTYRERACRLMLNVIEENTSIPGTLAYIPFRLGQAEFFETLLGCDPDLVVLDGFRCISQLRRLVLRSQPYWNRAQSPGHTVIQRCQRRDSDPSAKVSIVLPTYNGSKYLRQSLDSCLNQTYQNIELIVVDDCSTENIHGVVSSYSDPRLMYVKHEVNRGLSEALNTGFKRSSGEFLTWTSDDNYYADTAIEEMMRFLQAHRHVDFVYTDQYIVDESKRENGLKVRPAKPVSWLAVDNLIGGCFLYKRAVYEAVGAYDASAFLAEDYDYWIRIWKKFTMQPLFRPLYYYRYHKDSLTGKYSRHDVLEQAKLVRQANGVI